MSVMRARNLRLGVSERADVDPPWAWTAGHRAIVEAMLRKYASTVGSFLVRSDSAGISVERTWDHLGLRASRSDDVIFTDTPVPPGATAGLHDPSFPAPPDEGFLAWNSLGLAATGWSASWVSVPPARWAGRWPRCPASRPRPGRSRPP